jgi:hypothetical protein
MADLGQVRLDARRAPTASTAPTGGAGNANARTRATAEPGSVRASNAADTLTK